MRKIVQLRSILVIIVSGRETEFISQFW